MSNKKGTSRGKTATGDEVEELLLAAEDDLLLKLNLNSHLAHASSSSSPIDQDLVRRFEALKSSKIASVPPPQSQSQQKVKTSAAPKSISDSTGIAKVSPPETQQKEKSKEEEEFERILGADLSARFAALKGSSSSSAKTSTESQECPVRSNGGDDADVDNEEDEVEKLIQWAIDAARLDPSSPTDDDGDGDGDSEDDDDDDGSSEDEEKDHRRKQQQKKK